MDSVGSVLERALADEEVLLEEAAVLRAIRSSNRPVVLQPAEREAGASAPAAEPPPRPVRLRAIDGALSRSDPPNPA